MPAYLVVIISCHAWFTAQGQCACQLWSCLSVEAERGCGPAFECKYACTVLVNYAFRTSHAERDANMKRQLVEDLKTRLKFLQEMEKSYRGQVEDLEKKVQPAQMICCPVLKNCPCKLKNLFRGAVFSIFEWLFKQYSALLLLFCAG